MAAPVVVPVSLAAEIRAEHERAQADFRSAVDAAIRCGELLAQAKAAVGHGNWLPWLKENFPASERTARTYMRMWAERQRVADLGETSIRGVLAALAEPRAQKSEPADAPPSIDATDSAILAQVEAATADWVEAMAELGNPSPDELLKRVQRAESPEDVDPILAAAEARIGRALNIRRLAAKHMADAGRYFFDKHPSMAAHFLRLSALYLDPDCDHAEAERAADAALRALAELRAEVQA